MKIRMRSWILSMALLMTPISNVVAGDLIKMKVTVLVASDQGSDVNLVNDEYRDQLIKLFSYPAYQEISLQAVDLKKAERVKIALPDGYELLMTYQGEGDKRTEVQALIRREMKQYVFTVLSIENPGVVFLGGPPVKNGALIIVLETGF